MDIKEIIYGWLEERFESYMDQGCDEGASDPKDYARDEIDFYSDKPEEIADDYMDEVLIAFDDDEMFVLNNRDKIDQAIKDWYKERGYTK